jgi:hypothetical protein
MAAFSRCKSYPGENHDIMAPYNISPKHGNAAAGIKRRFSFTLQMAPRIKHMGQGCRCIGRVELAAYFSFGKAGKSLEFRTPVTARCYYCGDMSVASAECWARQYRW